MRIGNKPLTPAATTTPPPAPPPAPELHEVSNAEDLYNRLAGTLQEAAAGDRMSLGLALNEGAAFSSLPPKVKRVLAQAALAVWDDNDEAEE
jgi:hypothetical protein